MFHKNFLYHDIMDFVSGDFRENIFSRKKFGTYFCLEVEREFDTWYGTCNLPGSLQILNFENPLSIAWDIMNFVSRVFQGNLIAWKKFGTCFSLWRLNGAEFGLFAFLTVNWPWIDLQIVFYKLIRSTNGYRSRVNTSQIYRF